MYDFRNKKNIARNENFSNAYETKTISIFKNDIIFAEKYKEWPIQMRDKAQVFVTWSYGVKNWTRPLSS